MQGKWTYIIPFQHLNWGDNFYVHLLAFLNNRKEILVRSSLLFKEQIQARIDKEGKFRPVLTRKAKTPCCLPFICIQTHFFFWF